jgi:surfactin synthase thioesterase subunit
VLRPADSTKWLKRIRRGGDGRVVCFPWAGAGASLTRRWSYSLAPELEVVGVQLPGREDRLREAPPPDHRDLVAPLADAIARLERKPTILLGYSMGALLALETARALEANRQLPQPAALVVAACGAPARSMAPEVSDDADLVASLRRLGGAAADLTEDAALWQVIRPVLHADLSVVETYRWEWTPVLECPIVALGGADDPTCSAEEVAGWRHATRSSCVVEILPGGHFFMDEEASGFYSALNRHLRALLETAVHASS